MTSEICREGSRDLEGGNHTERVKNRDYARSYLRGVFYYCGFE